MVVASNALRLLLATSLSYLNTLNIFLNNFLKPSNHDIRSIFLIYDNYTTEVATFVLNHKVLCEYNLLILNYDVLVAPTLRTPMAKHKSANAIIIIIIDDTSILNLSEKIQNIYNVLALRLKFHYILIPLIKGQPCTVDILTLLNKRYKLYNMVLIKLLPILKLYTITVFQQSIVELNPQFLFKETFNMI